MRRLRRWLPPLLTLLLIAAGAAMPWAVFRVQDAYGENRQEQRMLDLFSLTLREEADLGQTLRLIQGGNYGMSDQAENEVLNEEEALAAVREVLALMADFGLVDPWLPESMSGFRAQLGALFSLEDEAISIPMWTVYSGADGGSCLFYLDDASGKIFLANVPSPGPLAGEELYVCMERWRQFIEAYYGVEIYAASEAWYDDAVLFNLPFRLGEDEELFQLGVYLYFSDGFASLTPFV